MEKKKILYTFLTIQFSRYLEKNTKKRKKHQQNELELTLQL